MKTHATDEIAAFERIKAKTEKLMVELQADLELTDMEAKFDEEIIQVCEFHIDQIHETQNQDKVRFDPNDEHRLSAALLGIVTGRVS